MLLHWLLLGLLGATPSAIQSPSEDAVWEIEKITWDGTVKAGVAVEIYNEYGDVRTRGAGDNLLAVSAMVQKQKGDEHQLKFDVERTPERLVLRVVYGGDDADTIKGRGKRRADVTVFVPFGRPFKVRTHNGLIEAKGLKSDVDFETFGGKVFCRIEGSARIKTQQAPILAVLKKAEWKNAPVLESVLGEVAVQLPSNANVVVKAVTSGEITTDYSLTIKKEPKGKKHALVEIGKGTYPLYINNNTGNVKILEGKWVVEEVAEN